MAIYKNTPPIVTNGLVLFADAANMAYQTSRNLLDYTTDLTNAFWSKSGCQITASAGIAPDGTNTAFALTVTNNAGFARLAAARFTASVHGGPYTLSFYVSKSNNCNAGSVELGIYDSSTVIQGVEPSYAIQNNFIPSGSGGIAFRRTTAEANGWYRIATTVTLTSSINNFYTFLDVSTAFGGTLTDGDVLYLWKPQFEASPAATLLNDIPTTVRFVPDLSFNGNTGSFSANRPSWTPNNGGSIAFLGSSNSPTLTYRSSPSINISGSSMTGEVWIKFNSLDYSKNSGSLMSIFRKGSVDRPVPHQGFWFAYDNRFSVGSFSYTCFGNASGGYSGGNNNFSEAEYQHVFQTGSWNHILFTINNSTASLYINGIKKGRDKIFSNLVLFETGSALCGETIFNYSPPKTTPFEISILKFYNRALSQQEVSRNYSSLKSRFNLQ